MSAQQPPSAAGGAPAAASGDAGGDADAAQVPVYDEALHREAFQAKVQKKFDDSLMVSRQSLTSAEVDLLISLVDGLHDKPAKQRGLEKKQVAEAMGRKPGAINALISEMSVRHEPALPTVAGAAGPSQAAAQGRRVLFENYKKDGEFVREVEVSFA